MMSSHPIVPEGARTNMSRYDQNRKVSGMIRSKHFSMSMKSTAGKIFKFGPSLQPRYAPLQGIMLDIRSCSFLIYSSESAGP